MSKCTGARRGWVTLSQNFSYKGSSPGIIFVSGKTRYNFLSFGVKILPVRSF